MTKDDLTAQLNTVLDNFVFGIALRCCFPHDLWQKLANKNLEFEHGSVVANVELRQLVNRMSSRDEMISIIDEYEKSLKRLLVREGHELISNYCAETSQFAAYRAQSWYQFARIIRNTVSHKTVEF